MKKLVGRITSVIIVLSLIMTLIPMSAFATTGVWDGKIARSFAKGDGSSDNPYIISSGAELAYLAKEVNSGTVFTGYYFELGNNIELNSESVFAKDSEGKVTGIKPNNDVNEWTPIGASINSKINRFYAEQFDGKGYSISGIVIESDDSYQGLFGAAYTNIQNLTIKNSYISADSYVGAIAGESRGQIKNCKNENSAVIGTDNVGGLFGYHYGGKTTDCINQGNVQLVSGENRWKVAGGIFGENYQSNVENCYNLGEVVGDTKTYLGGIVGKNTSANILNSFNSGKLKSAEVIGGVAGSATGIINGCGNSAVIEKADASTEYAGGVVGKMIGSDSEIANSYNVGSVTAKIAGGVVGDNQSAEVKNSYTTVIPKSDEGLGISPLSGNKSSDVKETNCYYVNTDSKTWTTEAEPKSAADMKDESMVVTLNNGTEIWSKSSTLNSGYPILKTIDYKNVADSDEPEPPKPLESPFIDVTEDDWFFKPVLYVVDAGLFTGAYPDKFEPFGPMTREMFITVLGRFAEKEGENCDGYTHNFTDVKPGSMYNKYIAWGTAKGIVKGYTETKFAVGTVVSREEACVFMIRFAEYMGYKLPIVESGDLRRFKDNDQIHAWAEVEVSKAVSAGIFKGYRTTVPGGYIWTFKPLDGIFRCEAAQTMWNYYEIVENAKKRSTARYSAAEFSVDADGFNSYLDYLEQEENVIDVDDEEIEVFEDEEYITDFVVE